MISSSRILSMQYYKMKDMHITFDIMIKYDAIYTVWHDKDSSLFKGQHRLYGHVDDISSCRTFNNRHTNNIIY